LVIREYFRAVEFGKMVTVPTLSGAPVQVLEDCAPK
jgi:hypothetical protein